MPRWRNWLGLNSSTIALLATIFCVTASTELWSPLVPEHFDQLRGRFMAGDVLTMRFGGAHRAGHSLSAWRSVPSAVWGCHGDDHAAEQHAADHR